MLAENLQLCLSCLTMQYDFKMYLLKCEYTCAIMCSA